MTEFIYLVYPETLFIKSKLTKCKLDQILGTKQYCWSYVFLGFFGPLVIFIYLFGHLVFYLFGPLNLFYCTSSHFIPYVLLIKQFQIVYFFQSNLGSLLSKTSK